MFPLAFVAGSLQGHWWGFISWNYVVWPIFLSYNVFIALKGIHFWFLLFMFQWFLVNILYTFLMDDCHYTHTWDNGSVYTKDWSVRVAERLTLPTSDHGVAGSNPAGGEILPKPKRRFIAQSLSCSPFHRLEMTEILLKGRKTLTHPTIQHKRLTS